MIFKPVTCAAMLLCGVWIVPVSEAETHRIALAGGEVVVSVTTSESEVAAYISANRTTTEASGQGRCEIGSVADCLLVIDGTLAGTPLTEEHRLVADCGTDENGAGCSIRPECYTTSTPLARCETACIFGDCPVQCYSLGLIRTCPRPSCKAGLWIDPDAIRTSTCEAPVYSTDDQGCTRSSTGGSTFNATACPDSPSLWLCSLGGGYCAALVSDQPPTFCVDLYLKAAEEDLWQNLLCIS